MLHMNKNNSYIVEKVTEFQNTRPEPVLVPKIAANTSLLRYDQWVLKYEKDLESLWDDFCECLFMMDTSEKYSCQMNMTSLRKDFMQSVYKTSYNNRKKYVT